MTDPIRPAVGLSVGATTLTAVTPERSVTRTPVITLFRHRPPEVGVPAENPALDEDGLVIADFVDRVGDPVGIVACDGSVHRAETLLADALRAIAYAATSGRPLPPNAAITHPAHWRPAAVESLRRAISQIPEWAADEPLLIPDTAAALTALAANPGLPTSGVIALCDFGGTGTSITLVDGSIGGQERSDPGHWLSAIAPTLRHVDFSGDLIDQGLLAHVIAELSAGGTLDVTGTSAIGSLTRLRGQCRAAKERLSTVTVTALPAELPDFHGDVRLTRTELDDAMGRSLGEFITVLQDSMERAGVRPADLAAVASVGGGAAIPVITTTLSENLRVPVITTPRPGLTGAIGAALRAARGPADDSATALAPAPAAPAAAVASAPATGVALAWSEAPDVPDLAPRAEPVPQPSARPVVDFDPDPVDHTGSEDGALPWYRRPMPVVAAALLVIVGAGAGTAVALSADSSTAPIAPTPSVTTTPQASPAPAAPTADPTSTPVQNQAVQQATQAPAPRTVVQTPAPVTRTEVVQAPPPPPVTEQAPPPVTETQTTTVVSTEVSTPPPVTQTQTATVTPSPPAQQPPFIPTIPPIPTIPGLPQIVLQPPSG
ncbi:Hsp70 family protein [Mycobacterium sp. CVI_P3]|uniref:Hsp70 family protein n=1 Tax=Mycobacterium pinniadriaticum TaxID=2994102 RepID=A0ABT3SCS5_9MYCO|nr:Hsp70 family protein [Mycobacterium pinniadriaticum]MCX2930900.1 Hsp70 family protein [Mycobacterium pinniadriaticum]MCX2937324.1 Hsp70 family protein [Mycobacterium pinniadriaticum]